jgi:hypothetical protein
MEGQQKLFDTLKRIAHYEPPEHLRRSSEKSYGLDYEEALEMAYENVLLEAKNAICGMRHPV